MNRFLFIPILLSVLTVSASAQRLADYRLNGTYSSSFSSEIKQAEISMTKDLFGFMDNDLRFGFGLSVPVNLFSQMEMVTAHKDLRKDDQKIDTLVIPSTQSFSINFSAHAEYTIKDWLSVGMEADLLGISGGAKVKAEYHPGPTSSEDGATMETNINAKPNKANAFGLANQKGMVSYRLYARLEPNEDWSFRLGLGGLFTEFATERSFGPNSQFRFQSNQPAWFVGLTYSVFEEN